jgi:prolyl-tRNA editing enzyme YbaK/EbsC (Cys-tRNA(Pro) deacylase)
VPFAISHFLLGRHYLTVSLGSLSAYDTMATASVEDRFTVLEKKHHACPEGYQVDDSMRRARRSVEEQALYSAVFKWVPSDYYSWALGQRAEFLTGSSENTNYLCKALVMENHKIDSNADVDPKTNPRFVLVIVQYAATLSNKKLATAIRSLRPLQERLDFSRFDFRIASMEDNDRLTGYKHNSVSPFGLLSSELAIVLPKELVEKKWFWMGGGHVDLKLRVATSEFVEKMNPIVADVSDPRDKFEALDD